MVSARCSSGSACSYNPRSRKYIPAWWSRRVASGKLNRDSLKRKRPGASNRMRVVGGDKATLTLEEIQSALLIEGQVIREATSDLFNIRTCLVQRQRKAIQRLNNMPSLGTHYLRDAVERF